MAGSAGEVGAQAFNAMCRVVENDPPSEPDDEQQQDETGGVDSL